MPEIIEGLSEAELQPIYNELKSGGKGLGDIDPAVARQLHPYIIGQEKFPEPEEPAVEASAVETVVEDAPVEDPAPAADPVAEPEIDEEELELEAHRMGVQRHQAREAKLTEIDKILEEKAPDRILDEDKWFEWRDRRDQALIDQNKILRQRDSEEIADSEKFVSTRSRDRVITSLGNDFEDLRLPKSFEAMNKDFASFDKKVMTAAGVESWEKGDREAAYARYQNDPDFAKQVGKKPEGLDTLFIYLRASQMEGNFEGNVLALARQAKILDKRTVTEVKKATENLAAKNKAALDKAGGPKPARVANGGGEEPNPIVKPHDTESARAWLQHVNAKTDKGVRRTASDREREDAWTEQARKILSGGQGKNVFVKL